MKQSLKIVHLYPQEMNIYGDRGNVLTLRRRLEWRGLGAEVVEVGIGDAFDFRDADIIFSGGGQDSGQTLVAADLQKRSRNLHQAAEAGVTMLTICGMYQLFGRRFVTQDNGEIPGIGWFAAETVGSDERLIGNCLVETDYGRLVGFENHSGRTMLDAGQLGLGQVMQGAGNNGETGEEGAHRGNVFGSYLHGPVLPKNPRFADGLLALALERKYGIAELKAINDKLEFQAARAAALRPR